MNNKRKVSIEARENCEFNHKGTKVVFEYMGTFDISDTESIDDLLYAYNEIGYTKVGFKIVQHEACNVSIYLYGYEIASGYIIADETL